MTDEAAKPEPTKEKKENKIRDLTPRDDAKGGVIQGKKDAAHTPRRTGEIDFMKDW